MTEPPARTGRARSSRARPPAHQTTNGIRCLVNVDDLVRIRIEEARRRIDAARRRRAELDAARQAGIAARHRAKLARLDAAEPATQTDDNAA